MLRWTHALRCTVVLAIMLTSSARAGLLCDEHALLSSVPLPQHADGDVGISGSHVFVTSTTSGRALRCIDVSNPGAPLVVGGLTLPSGSVRLVVDGTRAYVLGTEGTLWIVDVSDPASMRVLGALDSDATSLAVSGALVCLGTPGGVRIVDASDPTLPAQVAFVPVSAPVEDVAIDGDTALAAAGSEGLRMIDISDPAAPTGAWRFAPIGQRVRRVAAHEGTVCLATIDEEDTSRLYALDIRNPTGPASISSRITEPIDQIVMQDTVAYLASPRGVWLFDVSNVRSIQPGATLAFAPHTSRVAVRGGLLVVGYAAEDPAISLLHLQGAGTATQIASITPPSGAIAVDAVGDIMCLGGRSLEVYNVADPSHPALLADATPPDPHVLFCDILIHDNLVYALASDALWIVDLTDPAHPVQLGHVSIIPGPVEHMQHVRMVSPSRLAVECHSFVAIVDVSDPRAPFVLGRYDDELDIYGLDVAGSHAFIAECCAFRVLDISDPGAITNVGSFGPLPVGGQAVRVIGQTAYVTNTAGGLFAIDVSDPSAPTFLSSSFTYPFALTTEMDAEGSAAVILDQFGGVSSMLLVRPGGVPSLIARSYIPLYPSVVKFSGDLAYVCDGGTYAVPRTTLRIFDLSDCARCGGDLDADNDTDVFDFTAFVQAFGHSGLTPFAPGDLDGNGRVDVADLAILLADIGCGRQPLR